MKYKVHMQMKWKEGWHQLGWKDWSGDWLSKEEVETYMVQDIISDDVILFKYKSHLVIFQYSQEHGIDYSKVFVHVAQGIQ